MGTPSASARSIVAVGMLLFGGLLALFGLMFTLIGIVAIAGGHIAGHSGGFVVLCYGIVLAVVGASAARFGKARYHAIEEKSSSNERSAG